MLKLDDVHGCSRPRALLAKAMIARTTWFGNAMLNRAGIGTDSATVLRWHLRDLPALSEVPGDVLTWILLGFVVWLGVGVLAARLVFGAFGSGHSWERDEDDQELAKGGSARAPRTR